MHRVGLAEKIFGRQRVAGALQRVQAVSAGWGYRPRSSALLSLVAELFLIDQRPELESLSAQRIESARTRWRDSNSSSSLYFQLARVLVAPGVLASEPKGRERIDRGLARDARIAGIAQDWVVMVERWEATSTLIAHTRAHLRDALLKAGRWLHATHLEVTQADQWTRELAAEYVAAVSLNQGLIPILCRKAGIPRADARGSISSHRARSTIASQLFNARNPMTLFELQAWLGHRSPASTQHYVAFTPTRLARAYSEAHYFQRNLRMMHVLIDQQAITSGDTEEAWRYYDLGHGLCSYEFFRPVPAPHGVCALRLLRSQGIVAR